VYDTILPQPVLLNVHLIRLISAYAVVH